MSLFSESYLYEPVEAPGPIPKKEPIPDDDTPEVEVVAAPLVEPITAPNGHVMQEEAV